MTRRTRRDIRRAVDNLSDCRNSRERWESGRWLMENLREEYDQ